MLRKTDGTEEEFTKDHVILLYLIYKYSEPAPSTDAMDKWLKELPLRTLIYEAIVKGIFDYDYAPASVELPGGRRFLNISQEAEDDLADLREFGLIECLKVTTSSHILLNAYRVNQEGKNLVEGKSETKFESDFKESIDDLCTCPQCGRLIEVEVSILEDSGEDSEITLVCQNPDCSFTRKSEITYIEDVSYRTVPWLPKFPKNNQIRGGEVK